MRIASLILTLPVMLFSAQPLYRAAWSQLRIGRIGMDVPVVLGIGAAFVASAVATVLSRGQVYFDSVTMFVALVLGTRWVLARGLAAAREHIDNARRQAVLTAQRLVAFPSSLATEIVGAEQLRVGDRVLVPPGETVPADGVVVHGRSSCSQAWLTGESTPIEKTTGAPVLAGSVNLDQPMVVEVTRRGEADVARRPAAAGRRGRPRAAARRRDWPTGWPGISCGPCSPSRSLTVVGWWLSIRRRRCRMRSRCSWRRARAHCRWPRRPRSRRRSRRWRSAACCSPERRRSKRWPRSTFSPATRPGTLTTGDPALLKQLLLRDADPERDARDRGRAGDDVDASVCARAVAAAQTLPDAAARGCRWAGRGVGRNRRHGAAAGAIASARSSSRCRRSSPRSAAMWRAIVGGEGLAAASYVVLSDEQGALAVFVFGERCATTRPQLVDAATERGVEVVLLSGDRREPVQAVARSLGIERALAHQTPDSKRSWVAGQQSAGHRVAMLGDGLNDAPVIAQADVSIALAGGSMLAQARADFIVLQSRLADVEFALAAAHRARRIVRQNLVWAFAYNVVIIPLAAFGFVSPAVAAAGMAASSLAVVANALRAKRW